MKEKIKIIKLAERERQAEERLGERALPDHRSVREAARRAAATISGWVGDVRSQKRQDTQLAHMHLANVRMNGRNSGKNG